MYLFKEAKEFLTRFSGCEYYGASAYQYRHELETDIEELFPKIISEGKETTLGDSLTKAHSFLSRFSYESFTISEPPRCRQGLQLDLGFPSKRKFYFINIISGS